MNPEQEELIESLNDLAYNYAQAKWDYPELHKAWRSMCANNSVDMIVDLWRGKQGFINFIEDVKESFTDTSCKLKRKNLALPFSLHNVHWVLPKNKRKKQIVPMVTLNVASLKEKYVTQQEKEERINFLFNLSMKETLTPSEELELQILTDSLITGEINVPVTEVPTKYTDI